MQWQIVPEESKVNFYKSMTENVLLFYTVFILSKF